MALLLWTKINPHVKIIPTTRVFYGRYYYKLTFHLIGAGILPYAKDEQAVINRSKSYRHFIDNPGLLEKLKTFFIAYNDRSRDLRWRTEGTVASVFATTEKDLWDLVDQHLGDYKHSLEAVTRIQSQEDRDILESGRIIMRQETDYKFKVTVREGYRNTQERKLLGEYLQSIRSEVKISDHLLHGMISSYKYLHSCYFYVNDPRIVDMIALVAPKIIKKVQEVVIR